MPRFSFSYSSPKLKVSWLSLSIIKLPSVLSKVREILHLHIHSVLMKKKKQLAFPCICLLSPFTVTPNISCFSFSVRSLYSLSLLHLVSFNIYNIPMMPVSIYLLNFPLNLFSFSNVTPHSWKNMQTLPELFSYHFSSPSSKQSSAPTALLLRVYSDCCYAETIASHAEQYLIIFCLQVSIVSLA